MKSRYNPEVSIIVLYYEVHNICSKIRYALSTLFILDISLIILSHYINIKLLPNLYMGIISITLLALTLGSFHHNLYKIIKPIVVFHIDRYVK